MSDGPFAVGIDLGTTHCALAYGRGEESPSSFAIPQVSAAGEVSARTLLPSCRYLPAEAELSPGALLFSQVNSPEVNAASCLRIAKSFLYFASVASF